jgi:signal transduction histidine kinase
MRRGWLIASVGAAGVVLGIAAEVASDAALGESVADLATGWTILGCGLWGWAWRPDQRCWPLLAAAGLAWFAGNFFSGAVILYTHRGLMVHAVVVGSRTRSRLAPVPTALGYADVGLAGTSLDGATTIALAVALVVVALAANGFFLASLLALAAGVAVAGLTASADLSAGAFHAVTYIYEAALAASALLLAVGGARELRASARIADLVVELGPARRSPMIRDALAQALGDPSLEVAYWRSEAQDYVDADGAARALPEANSGRAVTIVEHGGERVAALIHDPSVLGDRRLANAVHDAAGLILANARLQEAVGGQLAELRSSRQRIVEARDDQRRRLARRLHDSVERELADVAKTMRLARSQSTAPNGGVDEMIERELDAAREELRELARGIHPRVLTEHGLRPALAALVERSPVPVTVIVPDERVPPPVEAAAYFVCSEALANVAKYARASHVCCALLVAGGRLRVTVADDGVGGADPDRGSGLRGLADRVDALGGRLVISSSPGEGTTITADLPLTIQGTH